MMHGQSENYTPLKQEQLKSLLGACYPAWNKAHFDGRGNRWDFPIRYFIDCMAGSGYDEQGNEGSPLIMQNFAKSITDEIGHCVWCDVDPKHTRLLSRYQNETYTYLFTGRYQDVVSEWIKGSLPRNVMGLIYLDDNGCQQIWEDDGFLKDVMSGFPCLDIAIHFSETAWARNNGAGNEWAVQKKVLEVLQALLAYKPASVIYAPKIRHNWRLVYGCRSGKMNLRGQNRIKLLDYIEARPESQPMLLEGIG